MPGLKISFNSLSVRSIFIIFTAQTMPRRFVIYEFIRFLARDLVDKHIDSIVQILVESTSSDLLLQVAVGLDNDSDIDPACFILPTRSNSLSWRTRSSLLWMMIGISPASSRNRVPSLVSSKRPSRGLNVLVTSSLFRFFHTQDLHP